MTNLSKELDKLEKKEQVLRESPFFKFAVAGDTIQGTLVTRMRIKSSMPNSAEQIAYVIKNAEGLHKVAFNATYPIHRNVENAVVGQEVRFKFTGTKASKITGYSDIKMIESLTRPDLINEDEAEWLESMGLKIGAPLPSVAAGADDEEGVTEDTEEEDALASEFSNARPVGHTLPRRSA